MSVPATSRLPSFRVEEAEWKKESKDIIDSPCLLCTTNCSKGTAGMGADNKGKNGLVCNLFSDVSIFFL